MRPRPRRSRSLREPRTNLKEHRESQKIFFSCGYVGQGEWSYSHSHSPFSISNSFKSISCTKFVIQTVQMTTLLLLGTNMNVRYTVPSHALLALIASRAHPVGNRETGVAARSEIRETKANKNYNHSRLTISKSSAVLPSSSFYVSTSIRMKGALFACTKKYI